MGVNKVLVLVHICEGLFLFKLGDCRMPRRMLDVPLPEKGRRGRQKTRWKDLCKRDMGLKEEDVLDWTKWKNDIHNHSGDPR